MAEVLKILDQLVSDRGVLLLLFSLDSRPLPTLDRDQSWAR